MEIMEFVGVSENDMQKELDEDPALDVVEEMWKWYCERMKLKKLPRLRAPF